MRMKMLKVVFRLACWLAILGALAWFLQPLYAPPKPTRLSSQGADDFVSWRFPEPPNLAVSQTLTVYGDGRSVVIIVRAIGDPDLPEAGWKIRRDKETGLIEFKKEDFLSSEKAKTLFNQAIEAGLLDLKEEKTSSDEKLEVQCSLGGKVRKLVGPRQIANTMDWHPEVWNNRLRWQKIAVLIQSDSTLKSALAKKEITLTNE